MFNEQQGLFKKDGRHRYSVFNALLNSVFKKVYVYVSWVIFFFNGEGVEEEKMCVPLMLAILHSRTKTSSCIDTSKIAAKDAAFTPWPLCVRVRVCVCVRACPLIGRLCYKTSGWS